LTYCDWAAAVVAGRLVCSVVDFGDFRSGERAAAEAVEEKGCEHEGLRLEMERMALEPGLMGIIFVAMVLGGGVSKETGQLGGKVGEKWRNED
jgi:hypothetical protein